MPSVWNYDSVFNEIKNGGSQRTPYALPAGAPPKPTPDVLAPDTPVRVADTLSPAAQPTPDAAPKPTQAGITKPPVQTGGKQFEFGFGGIQAPKGTPGLFQNLFSPIVEKGQEAERGLEEAVRKFGTEAGPQRTFESIGGTGAVESALTGGDVARGRELATARFAGPRGLGEEDVSELQRIFAGIRPEARALQTQTGVQTLTQRAFPSLTPGEARFEARALRDRPEFRRGAGDIAGQVERLYQSFLRGQEAAREFAGERAAQESDIARLTREYLTGERGEITEDIQEQISQKQAEEQALLDAYEKFAETGSLEDLAAIPGGEELAAQFAAAPGRQRAEEAQQIFQDIMAKYPEIAEIGPGQLRITAEGRERHLYDGRTPAEIKREDPELHRQLVERQRELERAGFSPGRRGGPGRQRGELADVLPLYFAGGPEEAAFQPADVRSYVGAQLGTLANRSNVSTAEQRNRFNLINKMLDQVDRIEESDPFEATKIMAEVDQYLEDEERALAARGEALDEAAQEWRKKVGQARETYKRKRAQKIAMAPLAPAITGLAAVGGPTTLGFIPDVWEKVTGGISGPEQRAGEEALTGVT